MAVKYQKGNKGKADRIFSKIIRSLGKCEKCGKSKHVVQLQTAHIISRKYAGTRASLDNAFCLCAGCHRYFTDHPVNFARFVDEKRGEGVYDELYRKAHTPTKVQWDEVVEFLTEYAEKHDIDIR